MDPEIRFQKRDRDQIHDVIVPVSWYTIITFTLKFEVVDLL